MYSIARPYRALIIGASGTLGSAFVRILERDPGCEKIYTIARSTHSDFDYSDPDSIARVMPEIAAAGPYSVVIDATGVLSISSAGPEKSIAALNTNAFERSMRINALGPMMMLRALVPSMVSSRCLYGKLSARVGSITDNRLGGWYSYRASKAALNMLLQTTAIELRRKRPDWVFAALQPGTVRSPLSARFVANRNDLVDSDNSAAGLIQALDQLAPAPGASFVDYRGQAIPW